MRLRLQTKAPLPELKAWFSPHPDNTPATVAELKLAICQQIPALRAQEGLGNRLLLLLDDFELLDDNPLDVVRDGDFIHIKALPDAPKLPGYIHSPASSPVKKRKRALSNEASSVQIPNIAPLRKKKKEFIVQPFPEPESSEESDSSSNSASSSSSSSSASSSSSSSSPSSSASSSSSSLSSSPPARQPSKPSKAKLGQSGLQPQHNIPPGYGKPQTHSRNLRRRIKKKHDKAASSQPDSGPAPPKNSSAPNLIPLGSRSGQTEGRAADEGDEGDADVDMASPAKQRQGVSTMNEDGSSIMMSTLRNKNKRKGFKQSMAAPLPRKIVFDGEPEASGSCTPPIQHVAQTLIAELPGTGAVVPWPRLVPPSEKQERGKLPPRMFVTSVDVEEGVHTQRQKKKKQKQKEAATQEEWGTYKYEESAQVEEDVLLNYPEEGTSKTGGLDWDRAEKSWEKFAEVTDLAQLVVEDIVGWKELALNPLTFSPEVLLTVASVVRMSGPNDPSLVAVRTFPRPGGSNPSLSHRLIEPTEDEMVDLDEKEYNWSDIASLQWRIVKL
ncbi:hypothetical protein DXG01_013772 [Tephrocybe rancida]|nr:hypothetical protein DXG01_013772 [Tephrocybe rancida]